MKVGGGWLTVNALTRTDLVLPLGRHNLSVDTRNVDTSVQASSVMSLDDISLIDLAGTDTTVVRALSTRETALGPAIWPPISVKESVLLLQTEPEMLLGVSDHQLVGLMTVVELVGSAIAVPGLAEDEDVVALPEGVRVVCDGANIDIGVVTWGLAGGRAVEVPLGKLVDSSDRF